MRRSRTLGPLAAALFLLPALLAPAHRLQAGVDVWTPIGPDGGEITALEANPRRPNVVYAGTRGGVFKSVDHGDSWRLVSRGLHNRAISAIAVAPSNGAVVYAASGEEVFVNRDTFWQPTARPVGQIVTALDVSPADPRQIWAGTQDGVFRSPDGGATWQRVSSLPIARVLDVAVDPSDPANIVYIANLADPGSGSGIYRTTNGGATWELLGAGQDRAVHTEHVRLAVDPTGPGILYASFDAASAADPEATYRSADFGATWQLTEGGYPVATNPVGDVYAGFMRSADRGQTWTFIAAVPGSEARHYAAHPLGGLVWAGTDDEGVVARHDTDNQWRPSSRGLHATFVTSLAINPRRPRVMYAATFSIRGARAFKTESSGARWREFENFNQEGFFTEPQLALSPVQPARVYLAWRHANGLLRTDNGGIFWVQLRSGDLPTAPFDPRQVLADPTDPDIVYLLGLGLGAPGEACGLARSTDRGHTFQCLPPLDGTGEAPFKVRLTADPKRPGRLWLPVRNNLIWRSDDFGATWTALRPRGLRPAGQPRRLAVDPVRAGRLYLTTESTSSQHVWRSDDGGLTWISLDSGLPGGGVSELLIDPQQPNTLYALVEQFTDSSRPGQSLNGVFWSRNGGRTWHPLVNGLPPSVTGLVMDPRNPRQLYALTQNLGIYAFTRQ